MKRRYDTMDMERSFRSLVDEFELMLERDLEGKELQFIRWIVERHVELIYEEVKSS